MIQIKYIIIILIILFSVYLYAFNMSRYFFFRVQKLLVYISKKFWVFMFWLNKQINSWWFILILIIITIYIMFIYTKAILGLF